MSVIVDIDLNADLSEFTSFVDDSGDLSWSNDATAQAVAGTAGAMKLVIDDTTAIYGTHDLSTSNTSGKMRCRFYIDVNSLTMSNNNEFQPVNWRASGAGIAVLALNKTDADGYRIRIGVVDDSNTTTYSSYYVITDAPHYIEVYLLRATGDSTNDGSFQLWIDRTSKETIGSIDNYTKFSNYDKIYIGAYTGIDAGTSGTFYIDEIVINDDGGEIGPAATNTPLTVADAAHALSSDTPALTVSASLVVADAAHGQTAESNALTVSASLIVADAAHTHAAETPALTVGATLAVSDSAHAHSADSPALTVTAVLVVSDAAHAHISDNITLLMGGQSLLEVQDAAHVHTADAAGALTSSNYLVVSDVAHSHTAENITLIQLYFLVVADAVHSHTADNIVFGGAVTGGTGIRRGMRLGIDREMVTE